MKNRKKIAAVLAMLLLVCALLPQQADAAVLKVGSTGSEVKTLQTKLKRWGYYWGNVDGIFGSSTKASVQYFQRTNGLTADGVVGPATAEALGLTSASTTSNSAGTTSSNNNLYLLAKLVYSEARGEPYKGQVAVAAVVLNRVESASFPNSVAGVVYQSGAFTAVSDGQINLSPDETAIKAARDAINGWDPTGGCLYYYNPALTTNRWMLSHTVKVVIGKHAFF